MQRSRARSEAALSGARRALGVLLGILLGLLLPGAIHPEEPRVPEALAATELGQPSEPTSLLPGAPPFVPTPSAVGGTSSDERTGTTTSAPPEDLTRSAPPHDAPHFGPGRLTPTPAPPGFNLFDGGWIRFYYHPSMRERVEPLISECTLIRRELSDRLGVPVLTHVRVDIARTPGEMATLAPEGAPYPDYAAGVAYSEIGLVLLTIAPVHPNDQHDLVQVFRHELAHIALYEALSGGHVPRWFNEGFAVLASGEGSVQRLPTLWSATLSDRLLPLSKLDVGFPKDESTAEIAYAEAVDVVRYLLREREYYRFHGLIERLRAGEEFPSAVLGSYNVDMLELEREWREDVAKRYTFFPVLFSGTVVWVGVIGLFVLGWRKKRMTARRTLQRWAVEEAREDALHQIPQPARKPRVHIVLARNPNSTSSPLPDGEVPDVPKVQHEGQWHTLH